MRRSALRRALAFALVLISAGALGQAGCGSQEPDSNFDAGGDTGSTSTSTVPPPPGTFEPGEGGPSADAANDALGALLISPAQATINVTIVDGVITANAPVTFTTSYNGNPVTSTWLFDRGELGDVSPAGVFAANGRNVGEGTVTARFGAREATAKVKIVVAATANGGASAGDAGFGGGTCR